MNEDIYIKNTLDGFCMKLNAGMLCDTAQEKIEYADKLRSVNSATLEECDYVPLKSPSIVCLDGAQNILPELVFQIGDEVSVFGDVLYGFYNFISGNVSNPVAIHLAADIAGQPLHYETETWDPNAQLVFNIEYPGGDGVEACYHVIRMPLSANPLTIKDATDLDVTSAWSTFTDSTYKYYLLQVPIAISDVTYKINE